jgi:hypothetical protein
MQTGVDRSATVRIPMNDHSNSIILMLQLYILPTPDSFTRARPFVWTGRSTLKGSNLLHRRPPERYRPSYVSPSCLISLTVHLRS